MEEKPQQTQPPVLVQLFLCEFTQVNPLLQETVHPEEKSKTEELGAVQPKNAAEEQKNKKLTAAEAAQFINKDHSDLNMVVAIRVRPLAPKEISNAELAILSIEDKLLVLQV